MYRGRGRVTGAAVASECLLVVTSRAVLLRFDFSVGMTPGVHNPQYSVPCIQLCILCHNTFGPMLFDCA